jgi:hypothetical protein
MKFWKSIELSRPYINRFKEFIVSEGLCIIECSKHSVNKMQKLLQLGAIVYFKKYL